MTDERESPDEYRTVQDQGGEQTLELDPKRLLRIIDTIEHLSEENRIAILTEVVAGTFAYCMGREVPELQAVATLFDQHLKAINGELFARVRETGYHQIANLQQRILQVMRSIYKSPLNSTETTLLAPSADVSPEDIAILIELLKNYEMDHIVEHAKAMVIYLTALTKLADRNEMPNAIARIVSNEKNRPDRSVLGSIPSILLNKSRQSNRGWHYLFPVS